MSWREPHIYPGAGQRWYYQIGDGKPYLVLDTFTGHGLDRVHVELSLRGLHPDASYLYTRYHTMHELADVIAELQANAETYLMEALL